MPPGCSRQFPIAEQAIEALGLTLWAMVEFEADDAIAAAAERFGADPRVERILICTPDKDMAQSCATSGSSSGTAGGTRSTTTHGVRAKWGVEPASVPDRLALVGDAADGFPGSPAGATRVHRRSSRGTARSRTIPPNGADWDVAGLRNPVGLAATLREQMADALLFRDLARLRTTADGVEIPEQDVDELEWRGADRSTWEAFCDEWEPPAAAAPARTAGARPEGRRARR